MGRSGDPVLGRPHFSGSFEHSLDDKGRLVVPARFRERLGASFFLTIGEPDPCLALYPPEKWSEFYDKLEAAPAKDASYRDYVRHRFAHTEEISTDGNGRLIIPAHLRSWAGLDKDVVLLGAMAHVEIWAKERYEQHVAARGQLTDFTSALGLF